MSDKELILASASPRRLQLLQQVGMSPAQVMPAEVDETPKKEELPKDYALRVAREKAETVAGQHPAAVVLAADTVVSCGRRILPKAETEAQARECLHLLSGRRHRVMTAVVVRIQDSGFMGEKLVETAVKFKRLTEREIGHYLASGEWRGKAGGYAIQGRAEALIPWINGSFSNVVGLPLYETRHLLQSAGLWPK